MPAGSGFDDDPRTVRLISGGELDASSLGGDCVGMISRAPVFQLTYDAGSLPLTFGVNGDGDTTLVINTPDGDSGDAEPFITELDRGRRLSFVGQ